MGSAGRGEKRAELVSEPCKPSSSSNKKLKKAAAPEDEISFAGEPIPSEEAKRRWPHRYVSKEFGQARFHYTNAVVDGVEYDLLEDAYIEAPDNEPNYIAKIVEMFETVTRESFICTQWFYRANNTVIKEQYPLIDARRVFYSDIRDDNHLSCISSKVKINVLPLDRSKGTMLDLYSGCGAMSSGLSIGASLAGQNIVTKWALDYNSDACESLKFNHPNTEVRNEDAEDFFVLLKEWEKLCKEFNLVGSKEVGSDEEDIDSDGSDIDDSAAVPSEEFEVEKFVGICYGNPNKLKKSSLHFKVRWKGYGRADDTWEPADGLSKCNEKIKEFVTRGHRAKLLPLPGDVDFLCGGPPCQGISGFNRFRCPEPLNDKKNRQLVVYMDIVEFLKPRYVLMENVTDILKFKNGILASYAVARLVSMNYQTRLGIMAAGAYGVPQCRMRFLLWGAAPTEILPQFPLPTHESLKKGVVTNEFKELIIGHGNEHPELHKPVLLGEVISELPEVTNFADLDEMPYGRAPQTAFQKFIRLKRKELFGYTDKKKNDSSKSVLYDHRPLKLNEDDYERVCHVPKQKGANFRNLPGLIIEPNKIVRQDPSVEIPLCKSGKPLVPNYAIKFESGKSSKPFGRLWYDEIVSTVVTRAEPHNQILLHPSQDRVLSVRENARLQGFPDCYKLHGPIKERYMQVGNAVSFAVSIPLGYCLAKAMQGVEIATPLKIPVKFPDCLGELKYADQEAE
ncbi:hypothetical protein MIMGU_mgv1a001955mg [Erythranthe guttata]|uniref:DNA (cytosine-5-)-methyltransferase n=1 Tax=Erythranthe guttata TaxID=4155 RepID=A0A022Q353_ERYGU|nr:hypothetical protein MIMGU_mgv1a001955mg [Erythranthe guttata]